MKLLDEIRTDLVNERANLSNTLRKAKILAKQLGVVEFEEWIRSELEGYREGRVVPPYRTARPVNIGQFAGPFQTGMSGVVLPTYSLEEPVKTFAENMTLLQGVGQLESMLATKEDTLQRRWPQEYVMLARRQISATREMVLVDAHQPLPKHVIAGVLDSVKNKLLDFILDLQKAKIEPEQIETTAATATKVRNLFNINIYGNQNTIASGETVSQAVLTVGRGDEQSLLTFLSNRAVSEEDLQELKVALRAEKTARKDKLGPKVGAWIGSMVGKAASGVWKVALEAAPQLLMEGIKQYYGW